MAELNIQEKYKKLVELLYYKTKAGQVLWNYDDFSDEISTNIASRIIKFYASTNSRHEPLVVVDIFNADGQKVETFNDEALGGIYPENDDVPTYYVMMDNLISMATRAAKGIDEHIDAIIDELDDSGPF